MHNCFLYVYFNSLHVSGSHVPIIRRMVCRSEFHSDLHTILLMMGTWLPETCRELK